jgi:hypothetical protein
MVLTFLIAIVMVKVVDAAMLSMFLGNCNRSGSSVSDVRHKAGGTHGELGRGHVGLRCDDSQGDVVAGSRLDLGSVGEREIRSSEAEVDDYGGRNSH